MNNTEHNAANINLEAPISVEITEHIEDNVRSAPDIVECNDNYEEMEMLNYVKHCSAIFKSQQIGEPELTEADKRKIAENLLHENPVKFLIKFGEYLTDDHLNFFLKKYNSYEVLHYVKTLKFTLNDNNRKILKRNRRYEAMKRMEAEGNYFSEEEMEKREPLLYYQMVGQYLSEKEKLMKSRKSYNYLIPTFSNFLINKMEKEELNELRNIQEKEEDLENVNSSSDDDSKIIPEEPKARWGESWEENSNYIRNTRKKLKMKPKSHISAKEKNLLLQEFKSLMQSNFLNGKDIGFNYFEVDFNTEYDSIDIRSQDEEEKYFDEETFDNSICTDTGIEDY